MKDHCMEKQAEYIENMFYLFMLKEFLDCIFSRMVFMLTAVPAVQKAQCD